VELGGSAKAAPGGYPVGAVGFGPCWEDQPTLRELYDIACAAIVRQEAEADELRAEVAMLKQGMVILAQERNEAREEARRATYDAAQETIKVSTVKSHWIEACREREEARDTVLSLRKQRAIARNFGEQMERERDEARVQFRSVEALGMALVKTIDELKTEKADLFVQLVNLKAGSRRSTLDEIAESVREKYEPEHEGEEMDNG
jgi:cell division protein FtsB